MKLSLDLEAAHFGHPDIEDDQGRMTRLSIAKKGSWVRKRFGLPTSGRKEPAGCLQDRRIVVNQANGYIMTCSPIQNGPLFLAEPGFSQSDCANRSQ